MTPRSEKLTRTLIVLLSLLLIAGAVTFYFRDRARREQVAAAREERQAPLIEVAPVALVNASPLDGDAGLDGDGYPTEFVDPIVLRALLERNRFDELTKAFEQYQDGFEYDSRKESWINDASAAFESAEPTIVERLDAWVAASPNSFAPYLARGAHWTAVAFARRGADWAYKTADEDFAAMHAAFQPALTDLDHALEMRPRLNAARRYEMQEDSAEGDRADLRTLIDDATKFCPACFQIRATYLWNATPRWGGSILEMQTYANNVDATKNARLKLLPAYVDLEAARIAIDGKDYTSELAAAQRACAFGEYWEFLYARAEAYIHLQNLDLAKADLDRAIALRPQNKHLLSHRAYVLVAQKSYEAAARDLLDALRMDPTEDYGRAIYQPVVQGIIYQAWQDHLAGHDQVALRELDLASELNPGNQDMQQRRAWILQGGTGAPVVDPAAVAAAVSAAPDEIEAVRKLDYALASQRRFQEILPLWDAYIAKHPDDGRAYLERGGTHIQLGQRKEAAADARRACELGVNEGCLRARQLGG